MTTQTIMITGASAGIGRDAAIALAARGHRVIVAARRLAALEELAATSPNIVSLRLDLDDADSIATAAAAVDTITGGRGLDGLVNNAGFATAGALVELSDRDLRKQFETNVFGLMSLTRALVPAMIARGEGRVVNVSSVSGRIPAPILGAYHASKYALEALSDALRMELAPFGVRVVIVEPGTIRTEFAARTMSEATTARDPSSRYNAVYDRVAEIEQRFDRMAGTPAPVVAAIEDALLSRRPRARYVAPRRFAVMIALVNLLPTSWVDRAMSRALGLGALKRDRA